MKLLLLLPLLFSMETNELNQENFKEIVLGGGCFWCIEAVFEDVKGVENIINGYSGGKIKNPSYREVSNSKTNHAEVCKIIYDEEKINLNIILEIFFLSHDPTTLNRQGNDIGRHYRSIILYNNKEEKQIIKDYIKDINSNLFSNNIVTETKQFEAFYKAEDYHQDYYKYNKEQPYCKIVITPKITKARRQLSKYY
ncbi:MAG: peptide-methionine (S)-S-oxide reductase MsrA [Flavobacteriales bacterium]|jgi:methionine-S-sulfoxide reductase|nr:peptide-methionine (S)-S-oxide reductase MsrA [Flavobacteriales bacterium]